jgi:hypothetical protein
MAYQVLSTLDASLLSDVAEPAAQGQLGTTGFRSYNGNASSIVNHKLQMDAPDFLYGPDVSICRDGKVEVEFTPNDSFNAGGSQVWAVVGRMNNQAKGRTGVLAEFYKIADTYWRLDIQTYIRGSGYFFDNVDDAVGGDPSHLHRLTLTITGVFPASATVTLTDVTTTTTVLTKTVTLPNYGGFSMPGSWGIAGGGGAVFPLVSKITISSNDAVDGGSVADPYPDAITAIVIGDSNSVLPTPDGATFKTWCDFLADKFFVQTGHRLLLANHGVGSTKAGIDWQPGAAFGTGFKLLDDAIAYGQVLGATHALIWLGTNDAGLNTSQSQHQADIQDITAAVTAAGMRSFLCEVPWIDEANPGAVIGPPGAARVEEYPAALTVVAAGNPSNVRKSAYPTMQTTKDNAATMMPSDGVHLTLAANQTVGEGHEPYFEDWYINIPTVVPVVESHPPEGWWWKRRPLMRRRR